MKRVLIVCTGNSARSQMAEGLFRHRLGAEWQVESAGTRPSKVREEAIAAMAEVGIDLTGHRSKGLEEFEGQRFDYVITVCGHAQESCPVWPGVGTRLHWGFEDPHTLEDFRRVRDEIAARLERERGLFIQESD